MIQQNAGASEEMAATAEELSSQAEMLTDAIGFFKVGQGGSRAPVVRQAAAPTVKTVAVRKASATKPPPASSGGGVLLDMRGGGVSDDAFEKF